MRAESRIVVCTTVSSGSFLSGLTLLLRFGAEGFGCGASVLPTVTKLSIAWLTPFGFAVGCLGLVGTASPLSGEPLELVDELSHFGGCRRARCVCGGALAGGHRLRIGHPDSELGLENRHAAVRKRSASACAERGAARYPGFRRGTAELWSYLLSFLEDGPGRGHRPRLARPSEGRHDLLGGLVQRGAHDGAGV